VFGTSLILVSAVAVRTPITPASRDAPPQLITCPFYAVSDIGRKDSHEFVRDASGARYTSAFLVEVGERLPGACLTSFSLLAPLLDCESYTMRNAVVSVTGSIVGAVLLQDRTDSSVKTRNQMLDILEERILDVSAYTRKQALSVWQTLADRKAIPLRRLTVCFSGP
jgi:condensin complex subunit 1